MPIVTSDIITNGTAISYTAIGQTYTVVADVTVYSTNSSGVLSTHVGSSLINHGTIGSEHFEGVQFLADDGYVYNSGAIAGDTNGVYSGHTPITLDGDDFTLFNHGSIAGHHGDGVHSGTGVTGFTLFNSGLITGFSNGVYSGGSSAHITNFGDIFGESYGIRLGNRSTLVNNGEISGGSGVALSGGVTVRNHGVIDGISLGIVGSAGSTARIFNDGHIAVIALADGKDQVRNLGTIGGTTDMGDGVDFVRNKGTMDVALMGGGDDTWDGRGGAAGQVFGGGGKDSLIGGSGGDVLNGGAAKDILRGGGDADTFVYANKSESTAANAGRDTIEDFRHALDLIDLSAIDANATSAGNQAFAFIGAAAFSAAGQLRFFVSGGDATVSADTDGGGTADFSILLKGVTALSAIDFDL